MPKNHIMINRFTVKSATGSLLTNSPTIESTFPPKLKYSKWINCAKKLLWVRSLMVMGGNSCSFLMSKMKYYLKSLYNRKQNKNVHYLY